MLDCEGYKMFKGSMKISPLNSKSSYLKTGVWLYKPDTKCWYCYGVSYPKEVCEIITDNTK